MYKVTKNNYILKFTKEEKGLVLKVSHKKSSESKFFSIISPGNVYMYNDKWDLLDTSTLTHERESKNYIERSSYDLIKVILLFPIKEILTLNYDEIFFLQALSYDLFTNVNMSDWLPIGNEYEFVDGTLISKYKGYTYTYEMPSNLGISLEDFLNKKNDHVKKEKKIIRNILDKVPLKLSPLNKKITHHPDSPIRIPLSEPIPSSKKDFESLPYIPELNYMDVTTEEIEAERVEKTESVESETQEKFNIDDITTETSESE